MMDGQPEPNKRAWALLFLLALIWGTSFILIKKGLIVLSPGEVGALRIATAGIFLAPTAIANLNLIAKSDLIKLLLIGMLGTFIPSFLFALAQTKLDSSLTGVFTTLTPVWVFVLGVLLFGQKLIRKKSIGIFIGLIGSIVLILSGSQGNFQNVNYYALFVVIATMLYATNVNVIKYYLGHLKATVITSVSILFVSPFAVIYLIFSTDFLDKIDVNGYWTAVSYVSLLGLMGTAIALVIFNNLVQITTPIFASSVTYLIPIVAICWGVMDGESLFMTHYLAIAIILVGVYMVNKE